MEGVAVAVGVSNLRLFTPFPAVPVGFIELLNFFPKIHGSLYVHEYVQVPEDLSAVGVVFPEP